MSKVLFRGPCDINAISCYVKKSDNIIVESAFKGKFLDKVFDASISLYLKQAALNEKIVSHFVEPTFYPSDDVFNGTYDWIVISIIGDGILGIYEDVINHNRIAYGIWTSNATKKDGEEFFNDSITHGGIPNIIREEYRDFASHYRYLGQAKPEDIVNNLQSFFDALDDKTKMIILLGPEFENKYGEKNPALLNNGPKYYKSVNRALQNNFSNNSRVYLLNPNDFYKRPLHKYKIFYYGYETINHYHIKTYYLMAKQIQKITEGAVMVDSAFYYKQLLRRNKHYLKSVITMLLRKVKNSMLFKNIKKAQDKKMYKLISGGVKSFSIYNPIIMYYNPKIYSGINLSVLKNVVFSGNGTIVFGDNCFVGHNTFFSIWSKEGIRIGNDVLIADNVTFHDSDHGIEKKELIRKQTGIFKGITVGDDVWIGTGAHILRGCHIGTGSVIGAGSVVTHDTPEYSISVGVPARVIGFRK